jgi:hypothetical protein
MSGIRSRPPFLLIESAGGRVKFSHTLAATEVVAYQWFRSLDEAVE